MSGEWFYSVGLYHILDTEPFPSQSSAVVLSSDVTHELDSVVNLALGIEHALSDGRRLYASFWTDFNASSASSLSNSSESPFALYHFGGGYSFAVAAFDVTLGGLVALGSAETTFDFQPPELGSDLVNVSYLRATFILGFNFAFGSGG